MSPMGKCLMGICRHGYMSHGYMSPNRCQDLQNKKIFTGPIVSKASTSIKYTQESRLKIVVISDTSEILGSSLKTL